MSVLVAEKITKSYSEKILFDKISLAINEGDKIGLIGINGTGKSTLLKVIAGMENADEGRIICGGDIKIEYLLQSPEFKDGTTVLEQVFKGNTPVMKLIREYEDALQLLDANPGDSHFEKKLILLSQKMDSMNAWSIETEAKRILTKLGIDDFKADVGKLSGGQRKRVAMAGVLITPADLLILDEPTNHIDNETVDWLESYINNRKGALLMVTHDRYLLDRVANRIIELDRGKLYAYQANYTKYLEMKIERDEIEEASESKRQNLIRRELEWIRRGARARSTKQKARIERFDNLTSDNKSFDNGTVEMQGTFTRLGRKIIEIENVSKSFSCGEIIKDFSYVLLRTDRIGIIGPNGAGKSTLMKIATGMIDPDDGAVAIGETVKIGYFSQENDDMDQSMRVIDYIRQKAEYVDTGEGLASASQMLERFLFPPSEQWTLISKLSGGEKRRLYLLRILMEAPNILMLDEPTNDLDIQTLTVLEGYLDEFPGAVVAISHDRYFLDRVVDRIFSFEGNGFIKQYAGNYTDYGDFLRKIPSNETDLALEKKLKTNTIIEKKNEKALKFTYKEKKEFDQIDDFIAGLEEKIENIKISMQEASSDFERLQALAEEKEKSENELEEAFERWTYLNELYEEIQINRREE
ncbi:MAG: ABC-F family ATP-binding cassette domain-containing protein [Peptostreptococcaceae bacterium]|nr:ABC-F family ATP-binding cassette domain-containing protein [Peptostreptococcaceae bacterium]